jgi:ERF superfamily
MTDNNVTKLKEPAVVSPGNYLQQAIAAGASIDVIERILAAQTAWETNQARKAYSAAIAAFKANPPQVLKNVEVGYDSRRTGDRTSYKHEDLAELLAVVDPALAVHGLWAAFRVNTLDNGKIRVACVIGHADGHSEERAELSSAPDTSGNKNPVQSIGSVVSYLQRYTIKAALGLAAAKDDDGRASGRRSEYLSDEQVQQIQDLLVENPHINVDKFLKLAGAESVSDILAVKFDSAIKLLRKYAKDKK